jgi:hypothetical protein
VSNRQLERVSISAVPLTAWESIKIAKADSFKPNPLDAFEEATSPFSLSLSLTHSTVPHTSFLLPASEVFFIHPPCHPFALLFPPFTSFVCIKVLNRDIVAAFLLPPRTSTEPHTWPQAGVFFVTAFRVNKIERVSTSWSPSFLFLSFSFFLSFFHSSIIFSCSLS